MTIEPIAYFRSPVGGKFGLPRQAGVASSIRGTVVLEPAFKSADALRGLEEFDYIWLIWGFSLNNPAASRNKLTVRPPRLGGNEHVGVFASRSPFRPNPIGLSSVRIRDIDFARGLILTEGADLADGTPIYDIKPYIEYADAHSGIRSGFTDKTAWKCLKVRIPEEIRRRIVPEDLETIEELLSQDPRPHYHDSPERVYGLVFKGTDIRFRVDGDELTVVEALPEA